MAASFCARHFYSSRPLHCRTRSKTSFKMSCLSRSSVSQIRRVAIFGICTFSLHRIAFSRSCVLSAKNVVATYGETPLRPHFVVEPRAAQRDARAALEKHRRLCGSARRPRPPFATVSTESRLS